MPDDLNASPGQSTEPDAGHVPMSEEMDSAKWTLPPIVPVLGAGVVILIVFAVFAFSTRTPPAASIVITKVATADMQDNIMVAVQVKIDNQIEKVIQIKNIEAVLEGADGKTYPDHAASSSEVTRYFQAFSSLAAASAEPLREELKILPRTSYTGVSIFAYPMDKATFDRRKSLTLRIQLYDQSTLVVKQ
jgi:hypothetical protein